MHENQSDEIFHSARRYIAMNFVRGTQKKKYNALTRRIIDHREEFSLEVNLKLGLMCWFYLPILSTHVPVACFLELFCQPSSRKKYREILPPKRNSQAMNFKLPKRSFFIFAVWCGWMGMIFA
jgi:hypothetical protein